MRSAYLPLILLLFSCKKEEPATETADTGPAEHVEISIDNPTDGAQFGAGEDVPLLVVAYRGETHVDIVRATWTIGDREIVGESGTVSDLAGGDYSVKVEALVDGETHTAVSHISVAYPESDTDTDTDSDTDTDTDTDTDIAWTYAGTMSAHVAYHGGYGDYSDTCPGAVNFTLDSAGVITGTGNCNAFDTDFPFTLTGTVEGRTWDCVLSLATGKDAADTPCVGTGVPGSQLDATFDSTFTSGSDSVRINGTWTASPL